ncbi:MULTISPECIES: O-antigen ligase family protein [unclassified Arenibacter]|uniref:O-antigen ligase family protein n=1 Tax=unclassified Arenibacter TaxID=2615047 RepID=UPI000E353F4D|nr:MULTISPECIES: O-antigen ligase family protein [unclassified Arenibacter]MCM4161966.1 hypothetical protein [Arenibacter sp. A80]RFT57598.1 hypothetical protein D0S24_00010 [Arenibacter sp. P308M17]
MTLNRIILLFILWDNIFLPFNIGFEFRLNYLVMLLFIILYLFKTKKISIPIKEIFILLILSFLFLLITILTAISFSLVLKQLTLITITFIFSFLFLKSYSFNVIKFFKDYIWIVTIAAVLVIVQYIGMKINFNPFIDYSYLGFDTGGILLNASRGRFHSWFYEPSFMAYAFIPVVFISVAKIFGIGNLISFRRGVFIIFVLIMTKSSIGLFGLLLSLILIGITVYPLHKKPVLLTSTFIAFIISGLFIYHIPAVNMRVNETYKLFSSENVTSKEISKTNLSTYALYSNYKITEASFKKNPFFGSGLGTYELNYDNYLKKVIPKSNWRDNFSINRQDANSLFFRLSVEIGLMGLLVVFYFIYSNKMRFIPKAKDLYQNLWIINNGIFILIILRLLRQGHYTMLGFILMLMVFYQTKKKADLLIKDNLGI